MAGPKVCVVFNPASGKNRAQSRLAKVRATWGEHVDFRPTRGPGDATLIAEQAARAGYAVVAAAGGDGTVHEVINGLMRAGRPDVQFALVPVGSAASTSAASAPPAAASATSPATSASASAAP
jgi:diacylglycerol kinase (ATP)